MSRVGDDNAGFELSFESATKTVTVRGWGFWGIDVAASFARLVVDTCRNRSSGALVMDMTQLKPMREEGQKSFRSVIESLVGLGIASTTVTTASQLTKLQLLRLASESGVKELVRFSDAKL